MALCLDAGADPLRVPLPDVIEAVFGFDVAIVPLGDAFDGLAARFPDGGLILASPTPNSSRQRFTLAHELGHLLAGDDQGVHEDVDIESAASRDGEGEVQANAFAAAFLMPASYLSDRVQGRIEERSFCDLVVELRVSPVALAIRLKTLNLIDAMASANLGRLTYAQALRLSGGAQASSDAAESLAVRPPARLASELLAAYLDGRTSLRPYAAALGVDTDVVRAQLESEE